MANYLALPCFISTGKPFISRAHYEVLLASYLDGYKENSKEALNADTNSVVLPSFCPNLQTKERIYEKARPRCCICNNFKWL